MNRRLGWQLTVVVSWIFGTLFLAPEAMAGGPTAHKYRYSDIDMPVSLAEGTVRTPEFAVKHEAYFIMLKAEKRLPFHEMQCMMALASGPLEKEGCNKEPLLHANWTVMDGDRIVAQGVSSSEGDDEYTDKYLFKFLGKFIGEANKRYIVEVKFTKDGTPLNVANPHLIVITVRNH